MVVFAAMLSQLQRDVHTCLPQVSWGTSDNQSTSFPRLNQSLGMIQADTSKKTGCRRRLPSAKVIACAASEQSVSMPGNQGVLKQSLTLHEALQPSNESQPIGAENAFPVTALSKAIELLRDVHELRAGQQNVGESVANVVKILQGLQESYNPNPHTLKLVAPEFSSNEEAPLSEAPVPDPVPGGNQEFEQLEDSVQKGASSIGSMQLLPPSNVGRSMTSFLRTAAQTVISFLKNSVPKSAGGALGAALLAAVLASVGIKYPVRSSIRLPKIAATVSVPYNHFLSHVNYDVVDKVEMVGQQVLYKLRDDVVYDPQSYQPEQEVIQALLTGLATLLKLRGGGSLDDAMLKTTLPAGHTLPLEKLVDNNVTLKAKQPSQAPQYTATLLAALLAGYWARKGAGKGAQREPASETTVHVPASKHPPFQPSPDPAVQEQPPRKEDVEALQGVLPLEKPLPSNALPGPNVLSSLLRWMAGRLAGSGSAAVPSIEKPALEQGAHGGSEVAETAPGEVAAANPGSPESIDEVHLTAFPDPSSLDASKIGAGNPTPSSPSGLAVTFVNKSQTKAVLYAMNPLQDAAETDGKKFQPVAWKIFDPQQTVSFDIRPRPSEIGAIRRESRTKVDRAGPFLTAMGAVWGMVQRSRAHTPMLKEGTPADFWYRFREEGVVSVVNARPSGIQGQPYEFGFYQDGELVLLDQANKTNDVVRFQVPRQYTFGALTSEAAGSIKKGGLLDMRTDIEPSVLSLNLDENVEKHIQITLTFDPEAGYSWDVTK